MPDKMCFAPGMAFSTALDGFRTSAKLNCGFTAESISYGDMKSKKVYILGAGCSVNYGYPLAKNFLEALKQYQATLERRENCKQLKQCLTNTVTLMEGRNAPTVDRLVRWIEDDIARQGFHWTQGLENAKFTQKVEEKIRDAKIATIAVFLEKEAVAWQTELSSYDALLHIIFNSNRNPDALQSTSDCVLSYNYDRLFEMAFTDYFKLDAHADCYAKNCLNAGLSFLHNQASDFAPEQFCFLKLHGTAAMQVAEQHGETRYGMNALRKAEWIVDDNFFWPKERDFPCSEGKSRAVDCFSARKGPCSRGEYEV
jgi:hypothetical protein